MHVNKAAILGLLGLLTSASTIFPAQAHWYQGDRAPQQNPLFSIDNACGVDPRNPTSNVCIRNFKPQELPTGYDDPGLLLNIPYLERYRESTKKPKSNGLPPCGIVYNGPCDPKKGI